MSKDSHAVVSLLGVQLGVYSLTREIKGREASEKRELLCFEDRSEGFWLKTSASAAGSETLKRYRIGRLDVSRHRFLSTIIVRRFGRLFELRRASLQRLHYEFVLAYWASVGYIDLQGKFLLPLDK